MNKIVLDSEHLRPATLAAMIADLLDSPLENSTVIKSLITQLENSVGEEMSIDFLAAAGITPGRGANEYVGPTLDGFADYSLP